MKLKKKKLKLNNQSKKYKIVVPYKSDNTSVSYKFIEWSK